MYRLKDINENCLEEFRAHWNCLENYNHQLFQCRRPERLLNRCVFQKIVCFTKGLPGCRLLTQAQGLEKHIPDTPKGQTPVHLRDKQLMADNPNVLRRGEKDVGIMKNEAAQAPAS